MSERQKRIVRMFIRGELIEALQRAERLRGMLGRAKEAFSATPAMSLKVPLPMSELPMAEQECGDCRFWDVKTQDIKENASGTKVEEMLNTLLNLHVSDCRRYPISVEKTHIQWCGEWKPRDEPPAEAG